MTFVDGLRGLAALAVVLVHASGMIFAGHRSPGDFLDRLSQQVGVCRHGVDVFFVISGFVIAHSIGAATINAAYAGRFALRRSLRLDPPYWVAIALMALEVVLRRHMGHEHPALPSVPQVVAHLFYLQQILGFGPISSVFWTLALEVQFYLVFILLLALTRWTARAVPGNGRSARAWVTAAAFAVSLLWAAAIVPSRSYFATWFGPHWHKFLIGAIIWYAWAGYVPRYVLALSLALLAIAVVVGSRFGPYAPDAQVELGLRVGLATALAFVAAMTFNGFHTWLSWQPLQFLGRVSYSLYLVHVPILGVLLGVQKRVALGSTAGVVFFLAVGLSMSIAGAYLMNLAVERPSIRLAARFKLKRDDLAGGIEGPAVPELAAAS